MTTTHKGKKERSHCKKEDQQEAWKEARGRKMRRHNEEGKKERRKSNLQTVYAALQMYNVQQTAR